MPIPLLFIDTNILLDFYRTKNDASKSLLKHIDGIHDNIITTYQVEMEFKKNRQKVILDTLSSFKAPDLGQGTPSFLRDAASAQIIINRIKDVQKRIKSLKGRIENVLKAPTRHDPVYQAAQRLFASHKEYHLTKNTPEIENLKNRIRNRARKRFMLGYPPRKNEDITIGDSVNWEWILHCVKASNRDIIIASRDSDYGIALKEESFVNDWLIQEIKNINQQRKVYLVSSLAKGLKLLDVPVTQAEERAEETPIQLKVDPNAEFVEFMKIRFKEVFGAAAENQRQAAAAAANLESIKDNAASENESDISGNVQDRF